MAKEQPETGHDELEELPKDITIVEAKIHDGFCNYKYELLTGANAGDTIGVTGTNEVHPDMIKVFERLNVHLAIINDMFKYGKHKAKGLDEFKEHEYTGLFNAYKWTSAGDTDAETIKLFGYKWVENGGNTKFDTPNIDLEGTYKYSEDLKEVIAACRVEVELYRTGKQAPKVVQGTLDLPDAVHGDVDVPLPKKTRLKKNATDPSTLVDETT